MVMMMIVEISPSLAAIGTAPNSVERKFLMWHVVVRLTLKLSDPVRAALQLTDEFG
jgi:hypothetical protein